VEIDPEYAFIKDAARDYFACTGAMVVVPLVLNEREAYLQQLEQERGNALKYNELQDEMKKSKATILSEEIKIIKKELGGAKKQLDELQKEIEEKRKERDKLQEEERELVKSLRKKLWKKSNQDIL